METLSKFIQQAGAKSGLYFLYICAQIFVLASLLLTATGIIVHIILMILTIGFYFATALKDPGVYVGAVEPNHEDVNVSKPQIKITIQKSVEKKWQSQKQCGAEEVIENNDKKSRKQIENNDKSANLSLERDVRRGQKRPSICKVFVQNQRKQEVESSQEQKVQSEPGTSVKKQTTNEILNRALTLLNNFTLFKSKKEIQPKQQPKEIEVDRNQVIENKCYQNMQKLQLPAQVNDNQLSKFTSRPQGINSMIGRQDFAQLQIQSNLSPEIKLNRQKLSNKQQYQPKTIVQRVTQIKRYCRICEIYQPLRVRHCHTCDKCIATFDHHCPWMANCIGQKNKIYFIVYLILQTIQLFTIMVDLIRFLSVNDVENSGSVGILLLAVILIFALMVILLCFHLYLIAKNITTWELLRWERIEYLNIFDKSKLTSLFDKGLKENLKKFWEFSRKDNLQEWKVQLTQVPSQYVIRKKKHTKTQIQPLESDRRPFKSQRLVRN